LYQRGGRRGYRPFFQQQNLYQDSVITPTGFIPTYAGMPIEQFNRTADLLKKEYDTNVAKYDAVQSWIASQNAMEGDKEALQEAFAPYRKQLEEIAKEGRYERMGPQVRAVAAQTIQDPYIKAIQQNYQRAEEARKLNEKMRAQGVQTLYDPDFKNFQTISYDDDGNKVINNFESRQEKRLDWEEPKTKLAGMLKADSYETDPERMTDVLAGWIRQGRVTELSGNKVGQKVQSMLELYMNDPAGAQEFKYLTTSKDRGGAGMSAEEARATILSEVFSAGDLVTFRDSQSKYMKDLVWEAAQKAASSSSPEMSVVPVGVEDPAVKQGEPGGMFSDDDFTPIMGVDLNKFNPEKQRAGFKGGVESFTFAKDEANARINELKAAYGDKFDELFDVTEGLGNVRIVPTDAYEEYTEEERKNMRDANITAEENAQFAKIVEAAADIYRVQTPDMQSAKAFQLAKKYQDEIGSRLQTFEMNTAPDDEAALRRDITGKEYGNVDREKLRDAKDEAFERMKFDLVYYDPETNEVITDRDDIKELVGDKNKIITQGAIDPASFLPEGVPEHFADSYRADIRDSDGNIVKSVWVSNPEDRDAYHKQAVAVHKLSNKVRLPGVVNQVKVGGKDFTVSRLPSGGVGLAIPSTEARKMQDAGQIIYTDNRGNYFWVHNNVNQLYNRLANLSKK
tara:strand:- start:1223 stop:3262 length:2040 start_codon:yes stop_codon:yes gene_type:complete